MTFFVAAAALVSAASGANRCVHFDASASGVVTAALTSVCYNNPEDSRMVEALSVNATRMVIASVGPVPRTWFNANFTLRGCANGTASEPARVLELGRVDFAYDADSGASIRSEPCWTVINADDLVLTTPAAPVYAASARTQRRRRDSALGLAVGGILVVALVLLAATGGCRRAKPMTKYGTLPRGP